MLPPESLEGRPDVGSVEDGEGAPADVLIACISPRALSGLEVRGKKVEPLSIGWFRHQYVENNVFVAADRAVGSLPVTRPVLTVVPLLLAWDIPFVDDCHPWEEVWRLWPAHRADSSPAGGVSRHNLRPGWIRTSMASPLATLPPLTAWRFMQVNCIGSGGAALNRQGNGTEGIVVPLMRQLLTRFGSRPGAINRSTALCHRHRCRGVTGRHQWTQPNLGMSAMVAPG